MKKISVGQTFIAQNVYRGSTTRGDYHFVKINLNEDDLTKKKEVVTLHPIEGAVEQGREFRITAINEIWITNRKYNEKWYQDLNVSCVILELAQPSVNVAGHPLGEELELPF